MGLLPQPKPTGNAAPEAAMEGQQPDPSKVADGEPNVSPEEQAEYEMFMDNAFELLYRDGEEGGEVRPEVLEALAKDDNAAPNGPIMALSAAAVAIVSQLDDSARKAGKPISDDVLMQGGLDVVTELAEIADAAKIHDYSEEDITGAFAQAVDMYRPKAIQDGRTSEETLKGQFNEINEAEAAGKLGDVLPGLGTQTVGEPPVQAQEG